MAISLKKNSKISLTKAALDIGIQKLSEVAVGLGWDVNQRGGHNYDLDAWALGITDQGLKKKNLVYFGNTLDSTSCIHHTGDNLTGAGEGDDEVITMKLSKLPDSYKAILVGVTIYRGIQRNQSFADVENTFIRVVDYESSKEICRYDAEFHSEEISGFTSMLFGIFTRIPDGWEFTAIGRGAKFSSIPKALDVYKDYTLLIKDSTKRKEGNNFMAVSLSKGGKVSLAKVAQDAGISNLTQIIAGLGWDVNRYDGGNDFDLDASAFLLGANGKARSEADFIFYSNTKGPGIEHSGDERTGGKEGDDEVIKINLAEIPADVERIAITVTIYDAEARRQSFGQVENSYIHIADAVTGTDLIRYDLGEDFSVETAIVVAELYRHNGEWKFNAVGSGFQGGLKALCANFGIDAE